jgi:hypothetical protein
LMLFDYVFGHAGGNPMAFALDYYAHFPRVALGHWPPLFELTQAAAFLFGRSGTTALVLQAVITGLCAGLPAVAVARLAGPILGLMAGSVVLLSPYALFLTNTVMADSFLAVVVFAAGLAWEGLYKRRSWGACLVFAAAASAAILTKGSAFALALLPPIYLSLKREIATIFNRKYIASACIIGVVTVPWYILTYKYAADGFNYPWGWHFVVLSAPKYVMYLISIVGVPIFIGYLSGIYISISRRTDKIDLHVALSLSIILFLFIVPADITSRYLISVLPSISITAVFSLSFLITHARSVRSWTLATQIGIVAALAASSILTVFKKPHVNPFHAAAIVALIEKQDKDNPLVLISGSVLAEGSVIAAFAEAERNPVHYVVRGTKVLSSGDFMGSNYKARFRDPDDMKQWILQNQIGYVVVSSAESGEKFSHIDVLRQVIAGDSGDFKDIGHIENTRGGIDVYALPAASLKPSPKNSVFAEIALHK